MDSYLTTTLLTTLLSQKGTSLAELSEKSPVLAVFLRHSGCLFCREALADLAAHRSEIESGGTQIAIVHLEDAHPVEFFACYGLSDIHSFSDPSGALYQEFDLKKGKLFELFGWKTVVRGAKLFFTGHMFGWPKQDVAQMPGAFLIHHGKIVRAYRHKTSADRPDYCELASQVESYETNKRL